MVTSNKILTIQYIDKADLQAFNYIMLFSKCVTDDVIDKPILRLGYETIKNKGINILSKKITEGEWWCYTKNEKITDYFNTSKDIPNLIYNYFNKTYNYININFNIYSDYTLENVYDLLSTTNFNNIYFTDRSAYFLIGNTIFSIDFYYLGFIDIEYFKRIKNLIREKKHIYDKDFSLLKRTQEIFKEYELGIEKFMVLLWN